MPLATCSMIQRTKEPSNIFWLHIQKTGTSLFNTIYLHFCPEVRLNISWDKKTRKLNDNYLTRNYPQVKLTGAQSMYDTSTGQELDITGHIEK